jgi:hypothetical protein
VVAHQHQEDMQLHQQDSHQDSRDHQEEDMPWFLLNFTRIWKR